MIGRRVLQYQILEKLGEGGMGVVYKAEDTKLHRTVALKFLSPEVLPSEEARARFSREAEAAASLDHPNICTVYEFDEFEGQAFLAMAYVEGQTLKEKIASGPIELSRVLDVAIQVAQGLRDAHAMAIVHRDVKPANVMITATDRVKIMDFGLARWTDHTRITRTDTTPGTTAYMSPEQMRGEEIDHRTDIWSFGVMLYEMLTGDVPFMGDYPEAVMYAILNAEATPVTALRKGVPVELERIVNRALAKDPRERYQELDQVLVDLRELKERLGAKTGVVAEGMHVVEAGAVRSRTASLLLRFRNHWILVGFVSMSAIAIILFYSLREREDTARRAPPSQIKTTQLVTEASKPADWGGVALSPNGQMLAYVHDRDLNLVLLSSGDVQTLVEAEAGFHEAYVVQWHPDGEQLVTQEWDIDKGPQIWFTHILSHRRRVVYQGDSAHPVMSPDGEHLAMLRKHRSQLWIMMVETDSLRMLREVAPGERLGPAVWSPDGKRLAYLVSHEDVNLQSIETCNLNADYTVPVEREGLLIGADVGVELWWLPDGRLVHSRRVVDTSRAESEFWVVDLDSKTGKAKGVPRKLFGIPGATLSGPTASADGKKLAFLRSEWHYSLQLLQLTDETGAAAPQPLTAGGWNSRPGVWSFDGRRLFYATTVREGNTDIFIRDLEAAREEAFVTTEEDEWPLCLKPFGSDLLYRRGNDLMSVPVDGGVSRRLTEISGDEGWLVRCAAEPNLLCVIVRLVGDKLVVKELRHDGKFGAEILAIDVDLVGVGGTNLAFDLSPDGSRIVVTDSIGRIRIVDLTSGEARELPNDMGRRYQSVCWSRDGKLLYVSGVAGEVRYWIGCIDLNGKFEVLWGSNDVWCFRPVPSPDGRYVAFGTMEMEHDVWMIEGF